MDQTINELKSVSDTSFDVAQQKQNYLEVCRARQTMSYSTGIFFVDYNLIGFLKVLKDLGHTESTLLDYNNNPVRVNVDELLEKSIERYHESVNAYNKLYQQLVKRI